MSQRTWKPRKPFMIERDGKAAGAPGDDFARITFNAATGRTVVKWKDWEGSRYATFLEAMDAMRDAGIESARVIEIIEETRASSR